MRKLDRLTEPEILVNKGEEWKKKYLEKCKNFSGDKLPRPDSSKYAHPKIKETLATMSFGKCFYCERKPEETQVDHHIEVDSDRTLAFSWENLYLACPMCNKNKKPHTTISVTECLDPCKNCPEKHLTFEAEFIKATTDKGEMTIKKYQLDHSTLDYKRGEHLRMFLERLIEIKNRMIKDQRQKLSENEKKILLCFTRKQHPFSLMFEVYLREKEVLQ